MLSSHLSVSSCISTNMLIAVSVCALLVGVFTGFVPEAGGNSCRVFKEPDYPSGCPRCTSDVNPVCGWNGKCVKWFRSSCMLAGNNCYSNETRFMECNDCKCSKCCQVFD